MSSWQELHLRLLICRAETIDITSDSEVDEAFGCPRSAPGRHDSPPALLLKEFYSVPDSGNDGNGSYSLENNHLRRDCVFCGKNFKNNNSLNNHISVYHREENRRNRAK